MKFSLSSVASRDMSLSGRFRRGARASFMSAVLLAFVTIGLTELTSDTFEESGLSHARVVEQRADVASLGNFVSLLAQADSPEQADELRVEIGSVLVDTHRRQAEIGLYERTFQGITVELPGETLSFSRAFDRTMAVVEESVELVSDESAFPSFRGDAVARAVSYVTALDGTYEGLINAEESTMSSAAAVLRSVGRGLFGFALVASLLRVALSSRPLLKMMNLERQEHTDIQDAQREVQMRSIVTSRLAEGMEAVDTEAGVSAVVTRTLSRLVPHRRAEVLLADSSLAHLSLHARNPILPTPGCGVQSPWSCPAVRRAGTQVFEDSEGIRACPHLANRPDGHCSAVCVPVSFVGESMGVIHVTGEQGWVPTDFDKFALEALAGQTAVRLGAIRSFARAEIQASTDVLTGLPNRRAVEDSLSRFMGTRARGAIAILDLDHFKDLNDTHGHEAGDRALRQFAEVLRRSMRDVDVIGRWGGEEFVALLPELTAHEAAQVLDRVRVELAATCARSDGPAFTVSVGVVDTSAGASIGALVALADECLYVAKDEGRDRVVVGPVSSPASRDSNENEVMA